VFQIHARQRPARKSHKDEKKKDPPAGLSREKVFWQIIAGRLGAPLAQSRLQANDIVLDLFKLLIQHAPIRLRMGVIDSPANIPSIQLEPFDLSNHFRFRIVNRTHSVNLR
jgi:hypothetical protein